MRFLPATVLTLLVTLAAAPRAAAQETGETEDLGPILESTPELLENASTVPS